MNGGLDPWIFLAAYGVICFLGPLAACCGGQNYLEKPAALRVMVRRTLSPPQPNAIGFVCFPTEYLVTSATHTRHGGKEPGCVLSRTSLPGPMCPKRGPHGSPAELAPASWLCSLHY